MSFTYGFYDSLNGDRKYNANQFGQLFDGIINDGVFMSIGGKLMVTAASGMNINVATGRAWFNSTWSFNDAIIVLEVPASEVLLNRIDTVVLEVNTAEDVRTNTIKIIKGTPATNPAAPTLSNSGKLYQHPLADIYVGVGVTEITQANITNRVGTSDCPFVTGILETMDIDALVAQWGTQWDEFMSTQETDFTAWYDRMKGQLSEDAAGHIQLEIDEIKEDMASTKTYTTTVGTSWVNNGTYVQQTVTVNGLLSSDNPIIDLVPTLADFDNEEAAWGRIFKAVAGTNSITLYATKATTTSISIQLKVVR